MEQLLEKTLLEYLEPASRVNKVPDNTSKPIVNDQSAVLIGNATMETSAPSNETTAFPGSADQVELIVPVSVEPTASIPVLTMLLANPLAGNMPTVPKPMVWKPRHTSPHLVLSESSLPH